jgi:transcriptional regulator with XRE-family HTH domain
VRYTTIKLRRLERHILQLEVAKRAAITWGRLSEIESGRVQPDPDELRRIAIALDIPAQHLHSPADQRAERSR